MRDGRDGGSVHWRRPPRGSPSRSRTPPPGSESRRPRAGLLSKAGHPAPARRGPPRGTVSGSGPVDAYDDDEEFDELIHLHDAQKVVVEILMPGQDFRFPDPELPGSKFGEPGPFSGQVPGFCPTASPLVWENLRAVVLHRERHAQRALRSRVSEQVREAFRRTEALRRTRKGLQEDGSGDLKPQDSCEEFDFDYQAKDLDFQLASHNYKLLRTQEAYLEKKRSLDALKRTTVCRSCGQFGHWQTDACCPLKVAQKRKKKTAALSSKTQPSNVAVVPLDLRVCRL